jgi:surface antigen
MELMIAARLFPLALVASLLGACTSTTSVSVPRPVSELTAGMAGVQLDDVSRQRVITAQQDALSNGRRTTWRGERGLYGFVEPGSATGGLSGECRDYTQAIYVDGRPQRGSGRACRQSDGNWQSAG